MSYQISLSKYVHVSADEHVGEWQISKLVS